jgi:Cu+-exporting ATPase
MDTLAQRRLLVEREKARLAEARRASCRPPADGAGDGLGHADAPLAALRLLELALSPPCCSAPGARSSARPGCWRKQREANMDTLIAMGAGAAWLYSLPGVRAAPPRVFRVGGGHRRLRPRRPLHGRARQGQGLRGDPQADRTAAGHGDAPRHGRGDEIVAIDQVAVGDRLRVRPGDKVPADGVVEEGRSSGRRIHAHRRIAAGGQGRGRRRGRRLHERHRQLHPARHGGRRRHRALRHRQAGRPRPGPSCRCRKLADRISARFVPAVGRHRRTDAGRLAAGRPSGRRARCRMPSPCC